MLISSWGYVPAQITYVAGVTAGHILFLWGVFALSKLLARWADRVFGRSER
jgi:hypothetical protein